MTIYINKKQVEIEPCTLFDVLKNQDLHEKKGIAIALNQNVVKKENWKNTTLSDNDDILVITATQGG